MTEPSLFFGSKHVCILRLYTTEYSHTICLRPWLHFRWIARLLAVLDQASHLAFADYICSCCMMSSEILMFSACSSKQVSSNFFCCGHRLSLAAIPRETWKGFHSCAPILHSCSVARQHPALSDLIRPRHTF